MKIGLLTELFPPHMGGQEVRFQEMAEHLADRGHEVTVLCIRHDHKVAISSSPHPRVQILRWPTNDNYVRRTGGLPRSLRTMVDYALWTRKVLAQGDFDVLMLNQWPLLHALTLPGKLRHRSILDWCEIREGRVFVMAQRFLPRLVGCNTAVSEAVRDHIEGVSEQRTVYLPSGINRSIYRSLPRGGRAGLLYLGRLTSHKQVSRLFEVHRVLWERGYRRELIIAGDGPELPVLRQLAAAYPMADKVRILGSVTEAEKMDLLSRAEVMVIASLREGFPRVVAEAMASGLPIVTANHPGNGTTTVVSSHSCGIVAAPTDDAMADAVQEILDAWDDYSQAALAASRRLDWSDLVDQLELEFISLAKELENAPTDFRRRWFHWKTPVRPNAGGGT
ncbi:glycosyltransferase family 4 protein (plasmid) [Skermanella sp. TT6]|uniref:Glycosyltransferase family 4 protein n=1 Tax=Skermanella cutis TaxID=2775420 RepID=A0ABX7BEF1_9PROT|nr:glycosyltransferase family 4 protein [Skermanella sp. TT6]QQP92771.1 glycosyltransferase family 4 protein [Skermanella sp. TT6]